MSDYIFYVKVANSKFELDAVSQAEIALGHTLTYRFDQSDSSNASHPLRFSTTTDGTHTTGGAEYTTGVTTAGTPGSSGAYTEIAVTSSTAASLYYYCSQHSGMGAAVITTGDTHVTTNNLGLLVPILADATDQWGSHINQSLRKLEANFGANANVYTFSISSTTSTISGAATIGGTLSFSAQQHVEVYLNGVKLVEKSGSTGDYTLSPSTNTITLESSVSSGDVVDVVCLKTFLLADAVPASGGTFTGAVTLPSPVVTNPNITFNTGNNTFTMPTTRGTDNYVLTRDDSVGDGGTAWKETALSPSISSITYPNGEDGNPKTALDSGSGSGTEDITIVGINFSETIISVKITVGGSESNLGTSFTRQSAEAIAVTDVTLRSAGTYTITVTNSGGLTATGSIIFSGTPGFDLTGQTNGDLGTVFVGTTLNKTITSTTGGDGTITFTNKTGENTPDWMTATGGVSGSLSTGTDRTFSLVGHASGGAGTMTLAGTTANSGTATTHLFGIIVKDSQNQGTEQDFSLTVADLPTYNGGTLDSTSISGYRIHWWKATDSGTLTFTTYSSLSAQILVVAGGGGGGGQSGAGGGAGGLRMGTITIPTGTYAITVGNGGTAGASPASGGTGGVGGDSSIGSLIVSKGGGGGGGYNVAGANGGSGGGGAAGTSAKNGGTALALNPSQVTGETYNYQGYAGGNAKYASGSSYSHGGGGGASAVGQTPAGPTSAGGNGGAGRASDIITTAIASANSIGQVSGGSVYFAGGGAGSSYNGSSSIAGGTGGLGGGGAGANADDTVGTAGTPHTGGGGGGGVNEVGGAGGSGIVIIRYAI